MVDVNVLNGRRLSYIVEAQTHSLPGNAGSVPMCWEHNEQKHGAHIVIMSKYHPTQMYRCGRFNTFGNSWVSSIFLRSW